MGFLKKLEELEKKLDDSIKRDKEKKKTKPGFKEEINKIKNDFKKDSANIKDEFKYGTKKINNELKESLKRNSKKLKVPKQDPTSEDIDQPNRYVEKATLEDDRLKEKKKDRQSRKMGNPKYREKIEKENLFREILSEWNLKTEEVKAQLYFHRESVIFAHKLLNTNELVINIIGADYGKLEDYKINGVLLVTDSRLIYANKDKRSQFKQEWKFSSINGIKESGYPLKSHQIQIEVSKSKKIFHKIKKNGQYKLFIQDLQDKIDIPLVKRQSPVTKQEKPQDKYVLLEKVAELKEKGILSEEEFQAEKEKILNN